ncbi:MAG TPA: hypothetical protein VLG47_02895 [Candidatus Saccharimonadales bacterium]|nr:hypothetical protein [Candidatus Saccharimonadales bacterium]
MGFFWDIFQEFEIDKSKKDHTTLEERVAALEERLDYLEEVLGKAFSKLDEITEGDFDSNSIVGDNSADQSS